MLPTTYGKGPFRPAIDFDDALYVLDLEYEKEEEAYEEAHKMWLRIVRITKEHLHSRMYYLKTSRRNP